MCPMYETGEAEISGAHILNSSVQDQDMDNTDNYGIWTGAWTFAPASNSVVTFTYTGTNATSVTAFDINLAARTGGTGGVFSIDLGTSTIQTSDTVFDFVDTRNHDDSGADAYNGVLYTMSGNWPGTAASTTNLIKAIYTGTTGASGALATVYAVHGSISGATLTAGTTAAGFYDDGANTVTLCNGTVALTIVGGLAVDTIDVTPTTNVDAIDIVGTNLTTNSAIDIDMGARTGSVTNAVFDILLDTTTVVGERVIRINDSRNHANLAADAYYGILYNQTGNWPGAFASNTHLISAVYAGTIGASGALASICAIRGDVSTATVTAGLVEAACLTSVTNRVSLGYRTDTVDYGMVIDHSTAGNGVTTIVNAAGTPVWHIGADVFSTGTFLDIAYDTAETLTGAVVGISVNLDTNVTLNDQNLTGISIVLPAAYGTGTEYALSATGDGKTVYLCDDTQAGYYADGVTTAALCDGTNAAAFAGGPVTAITLDLTPAANVDAIDIIGTNITTASILDADLSAVVSGQLIDIALDTTTIQAESDTLRITDARNHDNLAADEYRGISYEASGNWTGGFASTAYLLNAEYTGTTNGLATVYAVRGDVSGATMTGGTTAAGFFTDGTRTVTISNGTNAIGVTGGPINAITLDLTPGANVDAIDITCTSMTTASAIDINSSARTGSTTGLIDIALDTAALGTSDYIVNTTDSRNVAGAYLLAHHAVAYSGTITVNGQVAAYYADNSASTVTLGESSGLYAKSGTNAARLGYRATGAVDYAGYFSPATAGAGTDVIINPSATGAGVPVFKIGADVFVAGDLAQFVFDTAEEVTDDLSWLKISGANVTLNGAGVDARGVHIDLSGTTATSYATFDAIFAKLDSDSCCINVDGATVPHTTVGDGTITCYDIETSAVTAQTVHYHNAVFSGDLTASNEASNLYVRTEMNGNLTTDNIVRSIYGRIYHDALDVGTSGAESAGVEGCAGVRNNTAGQLTIRGMHGRTYVDVATNAAAAVVTNIGSESSPRISYTGGPEGVMRNGSVIIGHRIWMAAWHENATAGNIAYNVGQFIYNECNNAYQQCEAAIMVSDAGTAGYAYGIDFGATGGSLPGAATIGTATIRGQNGDYINNNAADMWSLDSGITLTPTTNTTAVTVVGTNVTTGNIITVQATGLTTGSIIDAATAPITTKTSGYLYNTALTTSVLDATTILNDMSISCAHDGLAVDTLRGYRTVWSGNLPQTSANADLQVVETQHTGSIGSGGAQGGTIAVNKILQSGTANGSAINYYGMHIDSSSWTNTSSNEISSLKITNSAVTDRAIVADGVIIARNMPATGTLNKCAPDYIVTLDAGAPVISNTWDTTEKTNVIDMNTSGVAGNTASYYFAFTVPDNFVSWIGASNDVTVRAIQDAGADADATITINVLDVDGSTDLDDDSVNATALTAAWASYDCAVTTAGTMTPGLKFYVKVTIVLTDDDDCARIGQVRVRYNAAAQ